MSYLACFIAAWMYLVSMPVFILLPRSTARGALQVLAAAGLAQELAIVYDHFSARHHHTRVALHAEAFEHRVIHAHVMRLGADGMIRVGIPQHDIRVAAGGQHAFTRVHAEDTRGRS